MKKEDRKTCPIKNMDTVDTTISLIYSNTDKTLILKSYRLDHKPAIILDKIHNLRIKSIGALAPTNIYSIIQALKGLDNFLAAAGYNNQWEVQAANTFYLLSKYNVSRPLLKISV